MFKYGGGGGVWLLGSSVVVVVVGGSSDSDWCDAWVYGCTLVVRD